MVDLAQKLSNNLNAAKCLGAERQGLGALRLKTHQNLAGHDDIIADLAEIVNAGRWFRESKSIRTS